MSKQNDGRSAFPMGYHPESNLADAPGMSLRDWFAGQALIAIAIADSGSMLKNANETSNELPDTYALHAYEQADAMLKARQQ